SRRRHTRSDRDWSSDVCSSDLVVNAVLLHPLDVSDPQNLYQLRLKPWTSFKLLTTSYPAYEALRRRNTTFSGMAGFDGFAEATLDRKSTRLNSSHDQISYAVFC